MATISSLLSPPNLLHHPTKPIKAAPKLSLQILKPTQFQGFYKLTSSYMILTPRHSQRVFAVAEEVAADPSFKAARRVYIGNISRTVDNAELTKIVEEHGPVEKAEEIGGREIKVNITEKPLLQADVSLLQAEESQFIDSPHKVYVGNLGKEVTTDTLKTLFSEKGKVLSAKVSRVPGTSKSSGFGFVSFSSEEDVEAAISSFNNSLFEGQRIRVNKA